MRPTDWDIPKGFRLSPAALEAINQLRVVWDKGRTGDPAGIVMIKWGTQRSGTDNSVEREGVALTFLEHSRRMSALALNAVRRLSGIDVIFEIPLEERYRFAGALLDFRLPEGFFLTQFEKDTFEVGGD